LANTNTNKGWQIQAVAHTHTSAIWATCQSKQTLSMGKLLEGVGKLRGWCWRICMCYAYASIVLENQQAHRRRTIHWRLSAEWVCILIKPVFRRHLSDADRMCTSTHPPTTHRYQVPQTKTRKC